MYKYSILGIFLLLSGCSEIRKTETVKAKVLSINENILEGKLIGTPWFYFWQYSR